MTRAMSPISRGYPWRRSFRSERTSSTGTPWTCGPREKTWWLTISSSSSTTTWRYTRRHSGPRRWPSTASYPLRERRCPSPRGRSSPSGGPSTPMGPTSRGSTYSRTPSTPRTPTGETRASSRRGSRCCGSTIWQGRSSPIRRSTRRQSPS